MCFASKAPKPPAAPAPPAPAIEQKDVPKIKYDESTNENTQADNARRGRGALRVRRQGGINIPTN